MNVAFAKSSHMNSCQSHFVLSTRRMFVFSLVSLNHLFQAELKKKKKRTTTKHYTTQAKKSNFCFFGSEAEAYDVISDADGTLSFSFFLHWVECLNVITCR